MTSLTCSASLFVDRLASVSRNGADETSRQGRTIVMAGMPTRMVWESTPRSRDLVSYRGRQSDVTNMASIFDVRNPLTRPGQGLGSSSQGWDVLRNDVLYLDYKARRDVLSIKSAHDRVVQVLNPAVRDNKSAAEMREELEQLKGELEKAHEQVHVSEARVEHTLQRLSELESAVSGSKPVQARACAAPAAAAPVLAEVSVPQRQAGKKIMDTSGPVGGYSETLKNFWFPVAFTKDVDKQTMIPFDCFEEPWVVFRGPDGRPGCIRDECAHRSCPLSLGTVENGHVSCPYHGWTFSPSGECTKMPSTKTNRSVSVQALPCVEHDGMIWVWPGKELPAAKLPSTLPPAGYTIHAEIIIELPVEHGLLVENLLDLAHAPFTHTSTFAKGWSVPSLVRFKSVASLALEGHWDPYPIAMEFRPPCMVVSTIGLAKPGKLEGQQSAQDCKQHLYQLHACLPSTRGKTRLLYRMGLDFASWVKHVPFIEKLWMRLANQVLDEDLRLVLGQQDRMERGANVWNHPVGYDKLGVRYRRWRDAVEAGERVPFT